MSRKTSAKSFKRKQIDTVVALQYYEDNYHWSSLNSSESDLSKAGRSLFLYFPMPKEKKLSAEEVEARDSKLMDDLGVQFDSAEKALKQVRDLSSFTWTEREALFLGKNLDKVSSTLKSQINTQDLQNLVMDGAARVMAQFPTGKVQAISRNDRGKSMLMNLVLEKYVLTNANAQHDMFTKFRMWDMYSRIYGSMPALVDWSVTESYVGPEFYLIHPRHMRPQNGKTTIEDCDYVFIDNWVSVAWLKKRDKNVWKNIPELLAAIQEKGDSKQSSRPEDLTYQEQQEQAGFSSESGQYAQVLLRTRYEKNRWVTFAPKYNKILRDIPNPQGNNEIPIVMKHCFPLQDRFYALGEFERGKTLAYAINSLVNLYMDGVKMSIFPPVILTQDGIVPSSIKYGAGQKWLETKPNSIRQLQISPQGMSTFQSTYGFLKSSLLNMGATTDTSVSKETDPGFGKTPEALKQQGAREGARDNWDRFQMEKSIEQVYNKMINLVAHKQEKPIKFHVFAEEVKSISALFPEENIVNLFESGEFGEVNIEKGVFSDQVEGVNEETLEPEMLDVPTKFRFFIDHGTTRLKDDEKENALLEKYLVMAIKNPQIIQALAADNIRFKLGELFKRAFITSGVRDWDKILIEGEKDPNALAGVGADEDTVPTEGGDAAAIAQAIESGQVPPELAAILEGQGGGVENNLSPEEQAAIAAAGQGM